jgi:uncharacterized protein YeaO (DUF488 family)
MIFNNTNSILILDSVASEHNSVDAYLREIQASEELRAAIGSERVKQIFQKFYKKYPSDAPFEVQHLIDHQGKMSIHTWMMYLN